MSEQKSTTGDFSIPLKPFNSTFEQEPDRNPGSNVKYAPLASAAGL
jgi:hypothetical protein